MSIPLREPLAPKVTPFFVPLNETLEMLLKVDMFRSNQMRITMQRFHELVYTQLTFLLETSFDISDIFRIPFVFLDFDNNNCMLV
jgi:hypothetical protein